MKHWLQLIAIPNAPASSSNQEMQSLKKRIADLEKARSRSPRRNSQKQNAITGGPAMHSLPAPAAAPSQGSKGGRGRNNRRKAKGAGNSGAPIQQSGNKDFNFIMKLPVAFRQNFHERFHRKEICCSFQKNTCSTGNCKFAHIVWAVVGPSLIMSAGALPTKSRASTLRSPEKTMEATPLSAVPAVFPSVKPEIEPKRVLLLASEAIFVSVVREPLERQLQLEGSSSYMDLLYLDPTSLTDFLAVLDLLAYIRQGIFDFIHILPLAATWSRSRHSSLPGQLPFAVSFGSTRSFISHTS